MTQTQRFSLRSILVLGIASFVVACGGGGGGKKSEAQAAPPGSSNGAPTITGKAATTVLPGQAYSFQPSATDPNGDALMFSATNVPSWASFDTTSGRLSGTPSASHVATYSNIVISVSDGRASASLAPFAIAVTETATGAATLSWVPPTTNSDGSALTDLSGYEVHYGRDENSLDQRVQITNPSISTYIVENLTSGTWYFAVAAVSGSGGVGGLSAVGSKTIS